MKQKEKNRKNKQDIGGSAILFSLSAFMLILTTSSLGCVALHVTIALSCMVANKVNTNINANTNANANTNTNTNTNTKTNTNTNTITNTNMITNSNRNIDIDQLTCHSLVVLHRCLLKQIQIQI